MEKAEILDAIRRVAADNGGVPPGTKRFRTATGITERAWSGRYWTRWGDALQEAGFAANTWVQPLSDEEVFSKFIALARELGRFPTTRERELRRRQDPEFPSGGVFRRLGSRAEIAKKLLAYCGDDDTLGDVREMCLAVASSEAPRREIHRVDPTPGPLGVVYLMKAGTFFKIGRSNHAGRRTYELAIQLPEKLELVHVIETDDPVGIERYWHDRFADRRANGEWFALTRADVAAFRRRKSFM